jgi:hypothetical protein
MTDTTNTTASATAAKKSAIPTGLKKLAQFQTPDGLIFDTQKAATEHLRKHLVDEALLKVAGGDKGLADWLKASQAEITAAYDAATVKREISEETRQKMREAMNAKRAAGKL